MGNPAIDELTRANRVDALCDQFESDWKSGHGPLVEDFLAAAAGHEQSGEELVRELLFLELDYRRRHGAAPTCDEYNRRFPDHPELVASLFEKESLSGRQPQSTSGQSFNDHLPRVGNYELLELIARGGMGEVHRARQIGLNRLVALKMTPPGVMPDDEEVLRFQSEAEAAAQLRHPNIVSIYEVGEDRGRHYYSMELVEGKSLAERLRSGPLPPRDAARLAMQVARAVHYAHEQGIVHRDLKPANVLIDDRGEPRIADFGVAKFFRTGVGLTVTGQVLGTPGYMAPEQATSSLEAIGPAADVYSLGALLYALLTARAPFHAATPLETLHQVVEHEPVSPRLLDPAVPSDLETIALKCLQKSPSHRYATAAELAEDLGRYLAGQPIHARPEGRLRRVVRWAGRHPVAASLAIVAVLVAGLLSGLQNLHYRDVQALITQLSMANAALQARNAELSRARETAEREERYARELLYASDIQQAAEAWKRGDARQLVDLLDRHVPGPGDPDLRGFEWHYFRRLAQVPVRALLAVDQPLYFVCHSPDGRLIAAAGKDAVIRILDSANGELVNAIVTRQGEVNSVAFSPDGRVLASTGDDGTVRLWNRESGTELLRIDARHQKVFQVAFALEGTVLVTCGTDPTIRVWNVATGEHLSDLTGHSRTVDAIHIAADGKTLVSGSQDETARLWDLTTRSAIAAPAPVGAGITSVEVALDAGLFLGGGADGAIRIWKCDDGELLSVVRSPDRIGAVAISADRTVAATGDWGGSIRLWSVDGSGRLAPSPSQIWQAHRGPINSLAWLEGGTRLLSAGADGCVVLSAISSVSTPHAKDVNQLGEVQDLAVIPGRDELAAACSNGLRLWNCESETVDAVLDERPWIEVVAAAHGGHLAARGESGQLAVWNIDSRRLEFDFHPEENVTAIALAPDGAHLAAAHWQTEGSTDVYFVSIFDVTTRHSIARLPIPASCRVVRWSPDGRLLAAKSNDDVLLWDWRRRTLRATLSNPHLRLTDFVFSPDSKLLAVSGRDRSASLWDVEQGTIRFRLLGHRSGIAALGFTRDGQTLATAGESGKIILWRVPSGQQLCVFDEDAGLCSRVQFTDDDRRFVVRRDSTIRIYDAAIADRKNAP